MFSFLSFFSTFVLSYFTVISSLVPRVQGLALRLLITDRSSCYTLKHIERAFIQSGVSFTCISDFNT